MVSYTIKWKEHEIRGPGEFQNEVRKDRMLGERGWAWNRLPKLRK